MEKATDAADRFVREYLALAEKSEMTRGDGRFSSPGMVRLFAVIYERLTEGAKTANLTAILDPAGAAERHFLDSVIPLPVLERAGAIRDGSTLVDVGCGAGFPSLPIAAAAAGGFPRLSVTALDSTAKKTRHAENAARAAGLDGVAVVTARAEEAGSPGGGLRERFDVSTARAVAALPVLLELTAPLVRVGGFVTAYKGRDDETEDAAGAAKALGLRLSEKISYSLPSGDKRTFLIYEKTASTPPKYPRQYAKITSSPIK